MLEEGKSAQLSIMITVKSHGMSPFSPKIRNEFIMCESRMGVRMRVPLFDEQWPLSS